MEEAKEKEKCQGRKRKSKLRSGSKLLNEGYKPKRQCRQAQPPNSPPRAQWTPTDIGILFNCITKYGHQNLKEIMLRLPHKRKEHVQTFMRNIMNYGKSENKGHAQLDSWLDFCKSEAAKQRIKPYGDSIQLAQTMKYLSVDGLLENHPLPDSCGGVDFSSAYRLLHQALLGYPLQSVNQQTAKFIYDSLDKLSSLLQINYSTITVIKDFLTLGLNPVPKTTKPAVMKTYARKKADPQVGVSIQVLDNSRYSVTIKHREANKSTSTPACTLPGDKTMATDTVHYVIESDKQDEVEHKFVVPTKAKFPHEDKMVMDCLNSPMLNPLKIPESYLLMQINTAKSTYHL